MRGASFLLPSLIGGNRLGSAHVHRNVSQISCNVFVAAAVAGVPTSGAAFVHSQQCDELLDDELDEQQDGLDGLDALDDSHENVFNKSMLNNLHMFKNTTDSVPSVISPSNKDICVFDNASGNSISGQHVSKMNFKSPECNLGGN
jgi:hypothetical protein